MRIDPIDTFAAWYGLDVPPYKQMHGFTLSASEVAKGEPRRMDLTDHRAPDWLNNLDFGLDMKNRRNMLACIRTIASVNLSEVQRHINRYTKRMADSGTVDPQEADLTPERIREKVANAEQRHQACKEAWLALVPGKDKPKVVARAANNVMNAEAHLARVRVLKPAQRETPEQITVKLKHCVEQRDRAIAAADELGVCWDPSRNKWVKI